MTFLADFVRDVIDNKQRYDHRRTVKHLTIPRRTFRNTRLDPPLKKKQADGGNFFRPIAIML